MFVGPGIVGEDESFDMYCVFGNEVQLNLNQAMHLRSCADELARREVRDYVCTKTKQFVMPEEGTMVSAVLDLFSNRIIIQI